MLSDSDRRVLTVAALSRLITCSLAAFLSWIVIDYDSSAEFLPPIVQRQPLTWLAWDTVYFDRIAEHGYEYEQYHAFFPLLPGLLKVVRAVTQLAHTFLRESSTVNFSTCESPSSYFVGLLISNTAFIASAVPFSRLSRGVLKDVRLASLAVLFYSFTPASIFHSVVYTESVFGLLTLWGCYILHSNENFWAACTLFAFSTAARSNGIINCGFVLHQAIMAVVSLPHPSVAEAVVLALRALAGCLLVVAPFAAFQYYGYLQFCSGPAYSATPQEWCYATLPNVYSFVQARYWGVGFLRYWQLQQLPNFLLAAPVLAVVVCAIWSYASANPFRFLTGGLVTRRRLGIREPAASKQQARSSTQRAQSEAPGPLPLVQLGSADAASSSSFGAQQWKQQLENKHPSPSSKGLLLDESAVYVFHLMFLALFAVTTMHVQVSTRFLSSSPALYWAMAHIWRRHSCSLLWGHCFSYLSLGCLLFPNFYPWT